MLTVYATVVSRAAPERGMGAPMLFVHETAATGAVWNAVADAVSERARAIVYDRRGWGRSRGAGTCRYCD